MDILPEELYRQIPKSSRNRFKHTDYSYYYGMEYAASLKDKLELARIFLLDKKARKIYRAYLNVRKVLIRLFVKVPKKVSFEVKRRLVFAIDKFRPVIGFEKVLKMLQVTKYRYHLWKNELKYPCRTSLLHRCFRTHPQQLSQSEVESIRELYYSPEYRGWPVYSIALHAKQTGKLIASVGTWYKYIKLLKLPYFRKRGQYEKNKVGLRGEQIHDYWHADVTILKTLDNIKAYIYFVMDNFSRYILSFRVSLVLSGKIMKENLREAYEHFISHNKDPIEDVRLITDGGPENCCEAVESYTRQIEVSVKQMIAGKDIDFSNSMVEAVNKVMKYRYLFHQDLANLGALQKYLEKAVQNYNCVRPHYSLKGHTPEQVLKGEILDYAKLKARSAQARLIRLEENRKASCGVCG